MSEQDLVDHATGYLAEAKRCLDVDYRNGLKHASYLGELTDLKILQDAYNDAVVGFETIKAYRPMEILHYEEILDKLKEEIKKLMPKPPKKIEKKTEIEQPKIIRRPYRGKK